MTFSIGITLYYHLSEDHTGSKLTVNLPSRLLIFLLLPPKPFQWTWLTTLISMKFEDTQVKLTFHRLQCASSVEPLGIAETGQLDD